MIRVSLVMALLLGIASCGSDEAEPDARLFVFGVRGVPDSQGQFVAATSDPAVLGKLEAELAVPANQRSLHIHGPIASGSGGHNLSWSWHFVPDQWDMVEMSIELCDGTPQLVEDDLDYWIETVGTFCPWASYVQYEHTGGP
jgi:hypothetical protein